MNLNVHEIPYCVIDFFFVLKRIWRHGSHKTSVKYVKESKVGNLGKKKKKKESGLCSY